MFLSACFLILLNVRSAWTAPQSENGTRVFAAKGIVEKNDPDNATVVIRHEAISNFMAAMSMPFTVKNSHELIGLKPGDVISFQLYVTKTDSWISDMTKTGTAPVSNKSEAKSVTENLHPETPLLAYKFTNELGQPTSFDNFRGQAQAIMFFYTRCPLPNFCPRLSKNFEEAQQKLEAMANAPTNWHLISVSFDADFDSPQMLKNYAELYHYDPNHWTFLTGSPDKIAALAHAAGVEFEPDDGTISHNSRTLIVDAAGHLQTVFPTSGDLSDQIVSEILKAAAAINPQ